MSRDRTVGDTFYIAFTTRAFATGIPTVLAGTPVISAYEDASLTQITAGLTLGVDHDSVVGLNMITIVATGGNGYETGKDYQLVITTGTVGGVSVVGEVIGQFSLGLSAAAVDLANGTDGLGALKTDTAAILVDTNELQTDWTNGGRLDLIVDDILLDTGTTLDTKINDIQGATFSSVTDSLEAIRDRGDAAWTTGAGGNDRLLMNDTTIATLATQTSFTLTAGSADNDAYNNLSIVVEDVSTATQKAVGMIIDYVGSTKTITLKEALAFTIATTDKVYILAENSLKSTVANRQLDVTATGAAGIDWGNVENKTTANDLSATDIQLTDTVTTLTGHTAQTGDSFARIGVAGAGLTDVTLNAASIDLVWDETMAGHVTADTAGLVMNEWQDGGRLDVILDARMAEASINTTAGAVDLVTTTTTATNLTTNNDKTGYALSAAGVDAIWDEVLTGATHNVTNSSGKRLRQIAGFIFTDGTAQSGGANSIQLASGDVTVDNQFKRSKVIIVSGTGLGQEAIVTSSVASTDTLAVTPTWLVNPDATSEYSIVPGQAHTTIRNGGYDGGCVYVDVVNGAAGTVVGVNGTTTNKVSVLADARTLADSEGLRKFILSGGGAFSLDQSYTDWIFDHVNGALITLNSKDISGTVFLRTGITGIGTATVRSVFELCAIVGVTTDVCNFLQCGFSGTTTLSAEDQYLAWDCFEFASTMPIIDMAGDGITPTVLELINYSGRVEIQNMTSTDLLVLTGQAHVTFNANCSGGAATLAGDIEITDSSGNVTITEAKISDILVDTAEIGTAGAGLTDLGGMSTGMKAEVNTEADTALTDYDPPTNTEMEARTPTAAQLAYMTANANTGLPVTFTTAGGSTTVAVLALVDGGAGSATNDQYNGRLLVFTDGTLKGVVTDITDYVGATTTATITAIPTAPLSSHNARLI